MRILRVFETIPGRTVTYFNDVSVDVERVERRKNA